MGADATNGFFSQYCIKCHDQREHKGDVRLDHVTLLNSPDVPTERFSDSTGSLDIFQ
ncbi:MAG: hypothetical protein QGG36_20350 [Pirellulaceae bacterium]|nr:hypothetical protein [Pirellulaceae bacterium]MDP7018167.1 hypothetical protein [Pirellulaceae bacterium]